MDLFLPKDGSIVIIDDKFHEAEPLLNILAKNGYPSIYFDGNPENMVTLDKVRVVFSDIQLVEALSTPDDYASMILDRLNLIIPNENGPYVFIAWSMMDSLYAQKLKERILAESFLKKPVAFITLSKGDYYKTVDDTPEVDIGNLEATFESRFNKDDIKYIINSFKDSLPIKSRKIIDAKALSKISKKIKSNLIEYKAFELLTSWENTLRIATTKFTGRLSTIHPLNEHWDSKFRNIIARLAQAQVGQNMQLLNKGDFIKASFRTISSAFSDTLEELIPQTIKIDAPTFSTFKDSAYSQSDETNNYKIVWQGFESYQLFINNVQKGANQIDISKLSSAVNNQAAHKAIVEKMISDYKSIRPNLNTRLLIDFTTKVPFQPGIVYDMSVKNETKRKFLTNTYFKYDFRQKENGKFKFTTDDLSQIKFVELEVSPNCDYAQKKWLRHRMISGIIIPNSFIGKYNLKLKDDDAFYNSFPEIIINDKIVKLVFSFKLLKSIDLHEMNNRASQIILKIRNEPMADIITKMSSHISRIGLIEFS